MRTGTEVENGYPSQLRPRIGPLLSAGRVDRAMARTTHIPTSRRPPRRASKVRLLFSLWRKGLVREGRSRRPLHHDEAAVRSLVAAVARGGEFVESGRKLSAVARFNGAFDLLDPRHDQVIHHLADRNALVIGDELAGLLEPFLQLIGLIGGKLPVADAACQPKFCVVRLRRQHDLDEAWCITFLGRLCGGRAKRDDECSDDRRCRGASHGFLPVLTLVCSADPAASSASVARFLPWGIAATRFSRWRIDVNATPATCSAASTSRSSAKKTCTRSTQATPQNASVV